MRVPKKTILTVGLALMFAACAQGPRVGGDDDKLKKTEFQEYRDSVMTVQMKAITVWTDSTYEYLKRKERQIRYLLEQIPSEQLMRDSIPITGDDPPPPPCKNPPCTW